MSEMIRRTKLERFVKTLEAELIELENDVNEHSETSMGFFYQGERKQLKHIIRKVRMEFKLGEEKK